MTEVTSFEPTLEDEAPAVQADACPGCGAPVEPTDKFIGQPWMAGEQEYLTALQSAATYSIRGDTLDLRTASGARAAAFQAAQ